MLGHPQIISLTSPIKGVVRAVAREEQPEGTVVNANNVLPYDLLGRRRVSQRYGVSEYAAISEQSTYHGGAVQGLLNVGYIIYPGQTFSPLPPITVTPTLVNASSTRTGIGFGGIVGSVNFDVSPNQNQLQTQFTLVYTPYETDYTSPYPTLQATFNFGNIAQLAIYSQASTDGTNDYVWLVAGGQQITPASVQYGGGPPNSTALTVDISVSTSYNGLRYAGTVTANGYTQQVSGSELSPAVQPVLINVTGSGSGSLLNPISTSSVVVIS